MFGCPIFDAVIEEFAREWIAQKARLDDEQDLWHEGWQDKERLLVQIQDELLQANEEYKALEVEIVSWRDKAYLIDGECAITSEAYTVAVEEFGVHKLGDQAAAKSAQVHELEERKHASSKKRKELTAKGDVPFSQQDELEEQIADLQRERIRLVSECTEAQQKNRNATDHVVRLIEKTEMKMAEVKVDIFDISPRPPRYRQADVSEEATVGREEFRDRLGSRTTAGNSRNSRGNSRESDGKNKRKPDELSPAVVKRVKLENENERPPK